MIEREDIEGISAVEAIRKRPSQYLPPGGNIRNHLLLEALCLSLAEAHCGTCSRIDIRVSGRTATIEDDGIGLSMKPDSQEVPFALRVLTVLYACRDHKAHQQVAHELCGAGIVVVNALSETLSAHIRTAGSEYLMEFTEGTCQGGVQRLGPTERTGTRLSFTIDAAFAGPEPFDVPALRAAIETKPVDLSRTEIRVIEA